MLWSLPSIGSFGSGLARRFRFSGGTRNPVSGIATLSQTTALK